MPPSLREACVHACTRVSPLTLRPIRISQQPQEQPKIVIRSFLFISIFRSSWNSIYKIIFIDFNAALGSQRFYIILSRILSFDQKRFGVICILIVLLLAWL